MPIANRHTIWRLPVMISLMVAAFVTVAFAAVPGTRAQTWCIGIPLTFQATGTEQAPDESAVDAHEAIHRRQCRELGTLRMRAMNRTPEGQLALEAPAFCAQLRWEAESAPHLATDPNEIVDHYAHTLRRYPQIRTLPFDQVEDALRTACPREIAALHLL